MKASISDIRADLLQFISSQLVADGVEVLPGTPFEQLGLDSFSLIEIVMFIERKYDLPLPDTALTRENLYSVESLASCVNSFLTRQ